MSENTAREKELLGIIAYLDDMDCWYLDEAPELVRLLREEFGFVRDSEGE